MATDEPMTPDALARFYADALREYVAEGSEAALARAYELGRKAAGTGLGILDLAVVHHDALLALPTHGAVGRPSVTMAAQFLAESLSPFEMTLRSYRANARLLGLSETLAQQNKEIDRARRQLQTILDATTAVIYMKDAEGHYLFVNRRFRELFGLALEEVVGRLDREVLPPAVASTLHSHDSAALEVRAPREIEELVPDGDGERTWLSLKFPLLDDAGLPYGLCCVATDITERKRAEEALQRAREAAERERRLKETLAARDQFLAITSHELRTPLTSLELQVAALRRLAVGEPSAPVSNAKLAAKCEVIASQLDRLKVLVNDLIDVGRITSGRLELAREPVDLAAQIQVVLANAREAVRRSRSEVIVRQDGSAIGWWDRVLVRTVVGHLLSNAVKFGDGKPIELAVVADGDRATLTVRDHGIGISAEDQQRIFERFERAVSSRHFGGFGIGLWVARQVVEAHGGSIRVSSGDGAGSEFTVELPLRPAARQAEPGADADSPRLPL
jgi:PAS domain S-box-containing protein